MLERDDPRVRDETTPTTVERVTNWLRVAVMVSGTIVFPFVEDRLGMHPHAAYALLAVGWVYSLGVVALRLDRRLPVFVAAWLTTSCDVLITLLWIAATGGVRSPWYIAFFVLIAVAAVRLRPRDTLLVAALAGGGYAAMAALSGDLAANAADTSIRAFYMVLLGAFSAVTQHQQRGRFAARLELLDLTQEVGQIGSWEWNVEDGTLTWSRELRRIFGVSPEARPTLEAFYAAVHDEDREMVKRDIERAFADRSSFRFDHRIVRSDGRVRWLHCRGQVLTNAAGEAVRMQGSTHDLTDARAREEELVEGRRLASLGALASGIAHEIKNPLAYVSANIAAARKEVGPANGPVADALEAAEDGCRRVAEIVRGLKAISRADEDASGPVDLASIAESALAIAAHETEAAARVGRDYGAAPRVVASESRLVQVALNLVVNAVQAIRAAEGGEHEIRVRVGTAPDGRALLEVSDTGAGIAEEHRPRIFEPFFTTKPAGEGTGLGLSISHGIIAGLGGEILVEPAAPRGTVFTVLLPPAPAIDGAPAEPAAERKPRVLVVDDEDAYARSLRLLLSGQHDVTVASDGSRALALLSEDDAYDVVLCDLMMHGMNGMDLHDALTAQHPGLVSRIVFLTGGATTDRARAFLRRKDVRHLEKPVEPGVLEEVIRSVAHPRREDGPSSFPTRSRSEASESV